MVDEDVKQGQYIVEYEGDVNPRKERSAREKEYAINREGCYILDVLTADGWMCVDATRKNMTVGRLLNHAPKDVTTQTPHPPVHIDGEWRVGFVTAWDLSAGEELTWDYGCRPGGIEWLKWKTLVGAGESQLCSCLLAGC